MLARTELEALGSMRQLKHVFILRRVRVDTAPKDRDPHALWLEEVEKEIQTVNIDITVHFEFYHLEPLHAYRLEPRPTCAVQ